MTNQVYLFTGIETFNWSLDQFQKVIDFCKQTGIAGMIVKIYEVNTGEWYQQLGGSKIVAHLVASQGLKWIPYGFFYDTNLGLEHAAILKFLSFYDLLMLDMESSWDYAKPQDVDMLVAALDNHDGDLWISTWCNPKDHGWVETIQRLDPFVDVWCPMVYFPNLVTLFNDQFPKVTGRVEPTYQKGVSLSDFKKNSNVSLWEYQSVDTAWVESVIDLVNPVSDLPPVPSIDFSLQQLHDIWHATGVRENTFIYQIWEHIRKKFFLGVPVGNEVDTVDWNGTPIAFQAFSSNYHIEYNKKDEKCRVYDSNMNLVFES
jgi:hypothetical protein